ncbi:MAG: hypothetical protein R3F41_19435 [Gammaproteobacteria bacterium]|nr:hypothetical protein [Pseudomonadales bacterium]MCP5346382.1 hypothetical protein [Pseudomonadales bacterium]
MKPLLLGAGLTLAALLTGCVASQPDNIANVCSIFENRRGWYKAARRSEERWGIPVAVNMAFIYQESRFKARAKPPRGRFLWILPGARPSSAYGYAQALDTTWEEYLAESGNWSARRDDFADAIDFVGWYNAMSRRINEIPADDAANLYFAYHEGNGGYARGRHWDKPWLLDTGARVQANSKRFDAQYAGCRPELEKNWLQRLFS